MTILEIIVLLSAGTFIGFIAASLCYAGKEDDAEASREAFTLALLDFHNKRAQERDLFERSRARYEQECG